MTCAVLGLLLIAVAVAGLLVRWKAWDSNPMLAVAAFTPYLMIGAPVGLLLVLPARSFALGGVAVAVLIGCVFTQADLHLASSVPRGVALTVMTANLRLGEGDPGAVVALVREHQVDVLTLQELTPVEAGRLRAAGLDALLPYSSLAARGGAEGVGLWSRFPLVDQPSPTGLRFQVVAVRVGVPAVVPSPIVVSVHLVGPWPGMPTLWSADMARMPAILSGLASRAGNGVLLVGGDFNSTPDTAQFRSLLVGGMKDAADQAGAGMTRTYPADTWYPPLIAIDHVLTRNAVATSARTLTVPGSDHRALLTTVVLPATASPAT